MEKSLNYYRVYPSVFEVGKKSTCTIVPLEQCFDFFENKTYSVKIYPMTRNERNMVSKNEYRHEARVEGKNLVFDYTFDKEEEYIVKVYNMEPYEKITQLSVYAVESDLFALRPLKGDLHVHSCRLIGPHTGSQETPGYTAADYRKAGYDFLALTDHECYDGSVEMKNDYKDVKLGMELINGEEIHVPENFMHFINLGGKDSVNTFFHKDKDKYYKEVQEIIDNEDIPYEDKFIYASTVWVARKTHEYGGLAVMNHPHWICNVYSMPDELNRLLTERHIFDAYEITGAASRQQNNMKAAYYYQMMKDGIKVPPIIGSSDSHGTTGEGFKSKYTILFAKENKTEDILDAIREYRTAVVEKTGSDDADYNVLGDYRYVSYAIWLIEHYFPFFPEITREEGKLMHKYILGDEKAKEQLDARAGNTEKLYKKLFGI